MRSVSALVFSSMVSFACLFPATAYAAPPVELELLTDRGFPLDGSQRWMQALQNVGATIKIRQGRPGEKGGITNRGSEQSPSYHVKGILSSSNTLRLPGATYRLTDMARLKKWMDKLKADGIEGLTAKTGAFGLTSKQLVAVLDQLSARVSFSTKEQKARDVAGKIVSSLPVQVAVDNSAREALRGNETVREEMLGLSSGTALAATLRPLGLVMLPQRPAGGDVYLVITDARNAKEVWPIGWPPEQSPGKTMPKLFEFLNVEIDNFVLSDALTAIQGKLEVPLLYDHNSMARHDADPSQVKVSLPSRRMYYKGVLDRLLAQSKPQLRSDLRVDEAGQPFLWITTMKR